MTSAPARQRDAARTRAALLEAARELFGARGYTATTVRQVAERAGVDPALVMRYFGSKTSLFIAALDEGWHPREGHPYPVDEVVGRTVRAGVTPLIQAAVAQTDDPEVLEAAARIIHERLVTPLLAESGHVHPDDAHLRAELAAAALAGIVTARATGLFETLAAADLDTVLQLARRITHCTLTD